MDGVVQQILLLALQKRFTCIYIATSPYSIYEFRSARVIFIVRPLLERDTGEKEEKKEERDDEENIH